MYSALVVDRVISVYILDAHTIGLPSYVITYPVLDFAVELSSWTSSLSQSPENEASAQHSNCAFLSGLKVKPLSLVPTRHCPIFLTVSPCGLSGLTENRAHWCTASAMSGLVDFSKKLSLPMTDQ